MPSHGGMMLTSEIWGGLSRSARHKGCNTYTSFSHFLGVSDAYRLFKGGGAERGAF